MKPSSLTLPALDWPTIDALIAGRRLVSDSRQLQAGDVFVACSGEAGDGRKHIAAAIQRGAAAVLWQADAAEQGFVWSPAWQVPNLAIAQLDLQAGLIAAHALGEPSRDLWTVGVTGTNGKTSISHWLAQAFALLGHKPALIGTLGYGFLPDLAPASHTTPEAVRLQNLLASLREQGASHVLMEVSSHGLMQGRAHGVAFDVAVLTNLTHDHLDYHGTMEAYAAAKARLFAWDGLKAAVINADDAFGAELLSRLPTETVLSYGFNAGSLRGLDLSVDANGLQFRVTSPWGQCEIRSPLLGRFNASNLLAVLGVLLKSGVSMEAASQVLGRIEPAKGRMQCLGGGPVPKIVVDYAHTPDALEKALTALRETMPVGKRLYCVIGCGGDRDRGKRPLMASVACRYADTVIITNDNPRSENPRRIINDMLKGIAGAAARATNRGDYSVESNRTKAIEVAIECAGPDDVVLIAGKGHEEFQEIGSTKHPFSDMQVAEYVLARWKQ